MVTLVILAFGMLASLVGIMAALDYSLMNEMRNDAMKIAQEQEEAARNMPYANIQTIPASAKTITRQVRKNWSLIRSISAACQLAAAAAGYGNGRMVQFTVQWTFKEQDHDS